MNMHDAVTYAKHEKIFRNFPPPLLKLLFTLEANDKIEFSASIVKGNSKEI